MSRPLCVIVNDLHFTPSTLELASSALLQAKHKASRLEVPLVLAGDTLDSKAIVRAECANRLITILGQGRRYGSIDPIVMVGNHELINEKGKEHSLNFLGPYCVLVDKPQYDPKTQCYLIPYQSDNNVLLAYLSEIPKGSKIIMHQGVIGAEMGHYIKDTTSLPASAFANFRVISGHYHKFQNIECGPIGKDLVGLLTYTGTQYTTSFAEANDGAKSYHILYENGTLESCSTNLRAHVILERTSENVWGPIPNLKADDIFWLKVKGSREFLDALDKKEVGEKLFGHSNFKLDKIYPEVPTKTLKTEKLTDSALFDSLIDRQPETDAYKKDLKGIWRGLFE